MNEREIESTGHIAKYVILAFITVIALYIRLDAPIVSLRLDEGLYLNISGTFRDYNIVYTLLIPILTIFYQYIEKHVQTLNQKSKRYVIIPAILFAGFMLFGYSFFKNDNWELVLQKQNLWKSFTIMLGYTILFSYIIAGIYHIWDKGILTNQIEFACAPMRFYVKVLYKHPFWITFITLLIANIPYIIVSYPTIFFEDAETQIIQAYQELGIVEPLYLQGHLLSEEVLLNNHHPIVHTLLLHFFLKIGEYLFHSVNIGVFLFSILQMLLMLLAIAYVLQYMILNMKIGEGYSLAVIAYYILSPRIQNYMFVVTKDVFYSMSLLYFVIFLHRMSCPTNEQLTAL